jgi:hypothetical protein
MADSSFAPTHLVPDAGLPTFAATSADQPGPTLDAGLEVAVGEWRGDWAHIACSNGWTAWVNGRLLVPVPAASEDGSDGETSAPALGGELASMLADALAQYATLVADLRDGRIDEETFRRSAFRAGLVVRDEEAWLLDLSTERWWRYDGIELTTLDVEAPAEAPVEAPVEAKD